MLIAPIGTGLRSRKGTLIRGDTSRPCRAVSVSYSMVSGIGWTPPDLGQDDVALELAEVEVEERAVDRRASDLLELDRQHLHRPVELDLPLFRLVATWRRPLTSLTSGGPDADGEVGGLVGQVGDRVQGAEDRVLVLDQPGHERLELDDQRVQLLVAARPGSPARR